MSSSCTQILVGVVILVSEILLLSKTVKFPFMTMDYSPWSSKNSIIWNQLKKFMQVKVNVLCMHTNFDGCRHSGFRDIATFKNDQISLSDHGLFDASVALVPTLLPPYLRTLTSTLPSLRVRSPINLPQLLLCYHVFIYSILFHSVSFFFHYSPWSL